MPTLTTQDPDFHNLDYYYNKYPDRFGIGTKETDPLTLRILPKDINPTNCELNKFHHYFKMPTQPALSTCLCGKFHTNFTSQHYQIPHTTPPRQTTSSTAMDISPNAIISKKRFNEITEILPKSPLSKQQQEFQLTSQITPSTLHTDPKPTAIDPHSQHYHTCRICKIKNIPCVFIKANHAPDYSKSMFFKGLMIHRDCAHNLQYAKLKPIPLTKPLTHEQRSSFHFYYFFQLTKDAKINLLQKLANRGKEIKQNPQKSSKQNQQQANKPARDTSQDLDWFANYPITQEMEQNTKLNTTLAQKLFNFAKIHLRKFTPGQPIPTTGKEPTSKPPQKQSFNYLLKSMAIEKPEFLTEFLQQSNQSLSPELNIPQYAYISTLKNLLTKFTELLFTKLNYVHIFKSHYAIPPYSIADRSKVAINFARLYLFLHNKYRTIHYQKFIEKLDIYPLRLSLQYNFEYDNTKKPLLSIHNNNRFTVTVTLNIPKTRFMNTFRIPSLKPYTNNFDSWFENFFKAYKKQFTEINETKVRNYLKYQIATTLADECKKYLPSKYEITNPFSLQDRSSQTTKEALYHIHTCKDKNCTILPQDTEHNFSNLSTFFFDKSFKTFPAPPKEETPTVTQIDLDFSIFHPKNQHPATFKKAIPIQTLNTLATEADQKFAKINKLETNPKCTAYYFYSYFKAYLNAASVNDDISTLKLEEALEKTISPSISPHTLARIFLYYDIKTRPKFSMPQIQQEYELKHYTEAEKFIIKHYKINIPSILDDSLFLSSNSANSSTSYSSLFQ